MGSSHVVLDQVEVAFDDEWAVANAGLLLPATLAERLAETALAGAWRAGAGHGTAR